MKGYEKININNGINLMLIPRDNYKTNIVTVYLKRPLNREEVTKNSLIPSVLKSATVGYPNPIAIAKKLQDLYGSTIGVSVDKMGERQVLSFRMYCVGDMYLPEPVFEDSLAMLKEIILHPLTKDGGFIKEYVDIEKTILEEDIKSKINNKGHYAVEKCIENMCKQEPFSISEDGYIEDLGEIDEKSLYSHYKEIIETSPIDIVIAGSFDRDEIIETVKSKFNFERKELVKIDNEQIYKKPEASYITEEMDINQGKLVLGLRTNMDYKDEKYYNLMMFSAVLGSGAHSKLFLNVREKHSLCYSIYSSLEKLKGLMFISAGIEISDYDKALELISKELDDMKQGNITSEELTNSKKFIINNLKSLNDNLSAFTDYYYSMSIQDSNRTIDDVINLVSKVEISDIVEVGKEIYLDTVYFLTGKSNN
ncbi:conserved protein of unknown function [Acetoanaerobium sticklandii]|uniref:Peptidase M16 C-terminal domain-containing protein n=1 Tax=Acetoanaerobium sticklandii (strain ATCC 12662 / DSM 519 / JCM 1433 / CCUG 9281 / NCIMB 10654 / HF) TaxID=499177 RepID=E3PT21_ACESD|nr:pitrilysin family protein [Acetoanaerobium sticklandii]CBH22025.1 conserved protein of unknown function [Acetoanaerobium sticklandii]